MVYSQPIGDIGNILIWAMQGALDSLEIGTSDYIVPLSEMMTGYNTPLEEFDLYSWRSGNTLVVPSEGNGWYMISFAIDHPSDSFGEGSVQEAIADLSVGINYGTVAVNRTMILSNDSAGGRPDSGAFSAPFLLTAADILKFIINADTSQDNEDFLVRAGIIKLNW